MIYPLIVFCAFTRLDMVERWFDDLYSTDLDPLQVSLALIIDVGEDEGPKIYEAIMRQMNMVQFRKFVILRNYENRPNEVNIPVRRQRIATMKNESKALIAGLEGEYVLSLEDDTVFPGLSVERLFEKAHYDQVGFVTAYEAGRWHNKIIGVWNFDDPTDPKECWTLLPDDGWDEIDAAGWYCYLTKRSLYLDHEYHAEVWQPWGPDVNFGLWLRKMGYVNYVDWTQGLGHHDGRMVIQPKGALYVESFRKTDDNEFTGAPQWVGMKQRGV